MYLIIFQYFKSLGLALLLSLGFASVGQAASFDCKKVTTETEIAICSDAELSALDELMGAWWMSSEETRPVLSDQQKWLVERNKCEPSFVCLEQKYQERFAELGYKILRILDQQHGDVVYMLRADISYMYQASAFLYKASGELLQAPVLKLPNISKNYDTCQGINNNVTISFRSATFEDILGLEISGGLETTRVHLTTFTKWAGHGDKSHRVTYELLNREFRPYKVELDTCLDGKVQYVQVFAK